MRWKLVVLSTAGVSAFAMAQPRPPGERPQMSRAPVFLTLMGEPFRGQAGSPPPVADWIAIADSDRNGSVSLVEFANDAGRFLGSLDANKNGQIDADEIERYEKVVAPPAIRFAGGMRPVGDGGLRGRSSAGDRQRPPEGTGGKPPGGGRGGGRPGGGGVPAGGGGPGLMGLPQPVAMADTDLNRIVTKEEFERTAVKRFMAADANGDRELSLEELLPPRRRSR